jgi:hypothetical protein
MEYFETESGYYELHSDYVLVRLNESSDADSAEMSLMQPQLLKTYTSAFAWVGDRINSFSYHPHAVKRLFTELPHLCCIALVTHGFQTRRMPEFERKLVSDGVDIRYFDTLDDAVAWVTEVIADRRRVR